jgi:hypothetical protein
MTTFIPSVRSVGYKSQDTILDKLVERGIGLSFAFGVGFWGLTIYSLSRIF